MRNRALPIAFIFIIIILIAVGLLYTRRHSTSTDGMSPTPESSLAADGLTAPTGILASPSPGPSESPAVKLSNSNPDLTMDASGLSRATVALNTTQGLIKFKFYPQDAPNTVKRIIELVNQGFYNGLIFHRVEPGFVIQGGDPTGTGAGGSGQKLNAEFSNRRHIEGTVAMARASDPNSADSQFYITLGTSSHLDHSYTVFGQVIEGMDVARKIKKGDKIVSMIIE